MSVGTLTGGVAVGRRRRKRPEVPAPTWSDCPQLAERIEQVKLTVREVRGLSCSQPASAKTIAESVFRSLQHEFRQHVGDPKKASELFNKKLSEVRNSLEDLVAETIAVYRGNP